MTRSCTICSNPNVSSIDAALRNGESYSTVANAFGVSKDSVGRHRRHTLAETVPRDGTHERAGRDLIDEAKSRAGARYSAQDTAEAENLLAVSKLADANPSSLAAQRGCD